jgi:uncharacterized protein (TIGR02246 family)
MRTFLLLLALELVACRSSSHSSADSVAQVNRQALTDTVVAQLNRAANDWNRGDLNAFLSDYAPESTTTFVDGRRARHGIDFIRQNYTPWFAPGARRDSLRFEEVEVRPLSRILALVTARFLLERGGQTTRSGPFTLVMERQSQGWKIIHDHSSSDPR